MCDSSLEGPNFGDAMGHLHVLSPLGLSWHAWTSCTGEAAPRCERPHCCTVLFSVHYSLRRCRLLLSIPPYLSDILALLAGRNQALCLGCSGFRLSPPCDTSSKHWVCVVDDVEPSSFTICAAPPLRFLAVDSSSSLLRGCPSTLPLFSDLPSIGDRVICVWCLREVSVALGPPPDTCCTLFLALQVGRWRSPVTPAPPLPLGPFRFRPFPPFGFHLGSKAQPNRCHSDAGEREKRQIGRSGLLASGRWHL